MTIQIIHVFERKATMMNIAVIGSGTMGTGLVQLFSTVDNINSVIWITRSLSSRNASLQYIRHRLEQAVAKGRMNVDQLNNSLHKLIFSDTFEALIDANLVIEAVSEDMHIKKKVFSEASHYIKPDTIFATNTSSLSITEISTAAKFKENVVGLHFFNPAPIMKLTEVVSGLLTSDHAKRYAYDFSKKVGKNPIFVNEYPGFVVNRMLIPMINEAIAMLSEGVASARDIDTAMVNGANHPIGPLSLADMIGNDICLSIMQVLYKETGDPKYRAHPLLKKMVRAQRLGRKSRVGFYSYNNNL